MCVGVGWGSSLKALIPLGSEVEGHLPDEGCTQGGPRDGAPAMSSSRFVVPSPPRALDFSAAAKSNELQTAGTWGGQAQEKML